MAGTEQLTLWAFRAEIREFVRTRLSPELARRGLTGLHSSRPDQELWGRVLNKQGWSAPAWPRALGGAGWSAAQVQVFDEECCVAGAPELSVNGTRLVGPVIYTFGTEEQKSRFLPSILTWDVFWGQGFSEPGSGSDLASLQTRAVADGNDYIVNGSKIWTTDAHFADWLFCLVRTDTTGRKQQGISFLLIDARTVGVDIRPIRTIDNQHTLNQIFFTDVRVPQENRIGPEGAGWAYAKFLLANERTYSAEVPRCKFYLNRLENLMSTVHRDGQLVAEHPTYIERFASLSADLLALESSVLALTTAVAEDAPVSPAAASVLKLKGSHLMQAMGELMLDIVSQDAIFSDVPQKAVTLAGTDMTGITTDFLFRRACTIYGGSAEIQRNIIAATLLPETREQNETK
jgi:alkylation response protein AidB-like acyl-CoA dehydrogenase